MKRHISPDFFIRTKATTATAYKDPLLNFLRIYFDFTYYLGMSPFRFYKDPHGNFVTQKWRPQQVKLTIKMFIYILHNPHLSFVIRL